MPLSRNYKETINERIRTEPEFASALLDEALTLLLNGEPDTARFILRDLVNATIGFETLADETTKPSKSLHRMLSAKVVCRNKLYRLRRIFIRFQGGARCA